MQLQLNNFTLSGIVRWIAIAIILVWTVFPIYWMLNNSFKERVDIFSNSPTFIPFNPTLDNYIELIVEMNFLDVLLNSFIVASASTLIVVAIAGLSAYSLSRYNFKGKNALLLWVILTRIFPPVTF